jgi:hypothetical protein
MTCERHYICVGKDIEDSWLRGLIKKWQKLRSVSSRQAGSLLAGRAVSERGIFAKQTTVEVMIVRGTQSTRKTDMVEHPREHLQTGPRLLMSCTHVLCTFKTNYLTRKVAIKRPYNHRRKKHPRDSNNKCLRG